MSLVTLVREGEIGLIVVNNPPVNALSPGVPEGILAFAQEITADPALKAGVLIGEGQTFIAGADIKEFGKMTSGAKKRSEVGLNPVLSALEDCAKPIVCAIHGTAFGGGLEFAMACHYRVALASAKVGQPEVKLGIIPGAGGTQRLPRLAGVMLAVKMCADGEPISAAEAHKAGILDELIQGDWAALRAGAIDFARRLVAEGKGARRTCDLTDKLGTPEQAKQICAMARSMAEKSARGMLAPFKAIDAVEAAVSLPFAEGLVREAQLFAECLFSPQSKALIHLFFGERAVSKIAGIGKDVKPLEIKKAAVVGAGTMGGGIAMNYVNAGIPVILKETKQELLDRGMEIIRKNYEGTVKKGKLKQEEMDRRMALITPTLSYDSFKEADIVVEAVFEDMAVKKAVFAELSAVTRPDTILASNTSTLNIDEIASATAHPEMVVGHHFFSPANVMKLLEVVRGAKTSPAVIVTSMGLAKKLRKVGVLVGNCFGFVGNRMIGQYSREAQFLVEEGASPAQVDKALTDFGMAMGPLAMTDLAGVDVSYKVKVGGRGLLPAGWRDSKLIDRLFEAGRYGQKNGKGYYRYEEGNRKPIPDPEVDAIVEAVAREAGIERRAVTDEEIVERTIYALVNEGAKILDEGFAQRASDIDIIYIYGYGFPPARGGPMMHADLTGLDKVLAKVKEFEAKFGEVWKPAPLLEKLAAEGKSFGAWDRERAGGE